ncbi:hypothetical protein ACFY3G_52135 [Streptomyces phaeochromogenes]|uniref:hypothetical protein n=1 Tax=Streptomyces phaeochromogenes TaxID=1923 RepID=UPI0036AAE8CB
MAERVRVREIDVDDGQRLLRDCAPGHGVGVTWRRAQMVLLSAHKNAADKRLTALVHRANAA